MILNCCYERTVCTFKGSGFFFYLMGKGSIGELREGRVVGSVRVKNSHLFYSNHIISSPLFFLFGLFSIYFFIIFSPFFLFFFSSFLLLIFFLSHDISVSIFFLQVVGFTFLLNYLYFHWIILYWTTRVAIWILSWRGSKLRIHSNFPSFLFNF